MKLILNSIMMLVASGVLNAGPIELNDDNFDQLTQS